MPVVSYPRICHKSRNVEDGLSFWMCADIENKDIETVPPEK